MADGHHALRSSSEGRRAGDCQPDVQGVPAHPEKPAVAPSVGQASLCGQGVRGWRSSGRSRTRLRIRGIVGAVPTINTTLGACEGLDVVVAMVVSPRPERAGQADQDGRPSGAARAAIDLSVVRGVGSSTVVLGSVGSYRPVIAGAKLREGTTTILPRGRALQGVGLSSMRFHPIGGGPEDDKDGQETWFTARIVSLIG